MALAVLALVVWTACALLGRWENQRPDRVRRAARLTLRERKLWPGLFRRSPASQLRTPPRVAKPAAAAPLTLSAEVQEERAWQDAWVKAVIEYVQYQPGRKPGLIFIPAPPPSPLAQSPFTPQMTLKEAVEEMRAHYSMPTKPTEPAKPEEVQRLGSELARLEKR